MLAVTYSTPRRLAYAGLEVRAVDRGRKWKLKTPRQYRPATIYIM